MTEPVYVYTIGGVWPISGAPEDLYEFVKTFTRGRANDLTFTEKEYEAFVDRMGRIGITLREVSRVPYHDPETVL